MGMQSDCEIVISSCPNYAEIWPVLLDSFDENWPTNTFSLNIVSSECNTDNDTRFNHITLTQDFGWSKNLLAALDQINTSYVLLMLDDFIIKNRVDQNEIDEIFDLFKKKDLDYLKLSPMYFYHSWSTRNLVHLNENLLYRISTISSLWKKSALQKLLNENESAWHFEIYGGLRSKGMSEFYCTSHDIIPTRNFVIKGKYTNEAYKYLIEKKYDQILGESRLEFMSSYESFILFIRNFISKSAMIFPARITRFLRNKVYNFD